MLLAYFMSEKDLGKILANKRFLVIGGILYIYIYSFLDQNSVDNNICSTFDP